MFQKFGILSYQMLARDVSMATVILQNVPL